jgi:hypothetical protein
MSMNIDELAAEAAELLPGREALGRLKFGYIRSTGVSKHVAVTKNIADVHASNLSSALNHDSFGADAESAATQNICITQ